MIIDASVAIKWLLPEDRVGEATALLERPGLVAPDLIFAEIADAIWKKVWLGEIASLPPSLDRIGEYFDEVVSCAALSVRACELGLELDHPACDCFYLALAERENDVLMTADRKFARKVATTPLAHLIEVLAGRAPE